jgi:hypothetical protein
MPDEMERLIKAMARWIVVRGGFGPECPESIVELVVWNLEKRKDEQCEGCGLSIMGHSIKFFEAGSFFHKFESVVR